MLETPEPAPKLELVDGELLVTPSPSRPHQRLVRELLIRLHPFVTAHRVGEVLTSPSEVRLRPEQLLQPDLYVASPHASEPVSVLVLAVEVVSPSSAKIDRVVKRHAYQTASVPEYWIVDGDAQTIERWRPGDARPEVAESRLEWQPEGASDALVIDLPSLFSAAADHE